MDYSKFGVRIAVVHDLRRVTPEGKAWVRVRVNYKSKQVYYNTGKRLSREQWAKLPTGRSNEYLQLRKDIEEVFNHVRNNVDELGVNFTFEALDMRMKRGQGRTLNELFQAKMTSLRKEDRVGSALVYRDVLKRVENCCGKNVELMDVTPAWLQKLTKKLAKDINATTIAITMRHIRAIMGDAKRLGLITEMQYPFGQGKYEIQEGEGRKLALTLDQIGEIARYDDGSDATKKYRDYWLFLYLCNGINVADFVTLKYKDIVNGEICFVRQKTAKTTRTRKEIKVVVTERMQDIINRYGVKPVKPNKYIFGCLDGSEDAMRQKNKTLYLTRAINRRMAKIGQELGYGSISTYTARHSFATVLKRAGASIAYISESLGHSDLKTTEHYLASFEREEREKNAELLTRF